MSSMRGPRFWSRAQQSSVMPIQPVNSRRCWQRQPASAIIQRLFKGTLPMRRWLVLALLLTFAGAGCGKKVPVGAKSNLVERDRDLYLNAMQAMKKSRFIQARLLLQTLLETYENSEYSAQAKYAYAESFYREAGHGNLISAESEFRKFLTFFPDHELSDDAQMMVAMTHVRQLERPDRDNTEAQLAEYELNEMVNKFPDSPLLEEAKEKLRGVQELIAEGILGPAKQY